MSRQTCRGILALALLVAAVVPARSAAGTTGAAIAVRPSSGPPTTSTTVAGRGYEPGETVDVALDGPLLATTQTGATVPVAAAVTVRPSAPPAAHHVSPT